MFRRLYDLYGLQYPPMLGNANITITAIPFVGQNSNDGTRVSKLMMQGYRQTARLHGPPPPPPPHTHTAPPSRRCVGYHPRLAAEVKAQQTKLSAGCRFRCPPTAMLRVATTWRPRRCVKATVQGTLPEAFRSSTDGMLTRSFLACSEGEMADPSGFRRLGIGRTQGSHHVLSAPSALCTHVCRRSPHYPTVYYVQEHPRELLRWIKRRNGTDTLGQAFRTSSLSSSASWQRLQRATHLRPLRQQLLRYHPLHDTTHSVSLRIACLHMSVLRHLALRVCTIQAELGYLLVCSGTAPHHPG